MTGLVYLAGPIDQGRGAVHVLRQEARYKLEQAGLDFYDPASAFTIAPGAEPHDGVYKINHRALQQSDGVLALLPDGVPTIGTPMEVEQAVSLFGLPVGVVGGSGWQLAARSDWVRTYETVEDAIGWVVREMAARGGKHTRARVDPIAVAGDGRTPERHYEGDAGFDLYVSEKCVIPAGEFVDIPCGVSVQLPQHVWAMLVGRSSTLRRRGLMVYQGVIDQGYRGPLYAGVLNTGGRQQVVEVGERIAQLIPMPLVSRHLAPVRVAELDPSDRGENGFGSSGV